jgi:hypothetical protein
MSRQVSIDRVTNQARCCGLSLLSHLCKRVVLILSEIDLRSVHVVQLRIVFHISARTGVSEVWMTAAMNDW